MLISFTDGYKHSYKLGLRCDTISDAAVNKRTASLFAGLIIKRPSGTGPGHACLLRRGLRI